MEVIVKMRNKKITVRLNENEEKALEALREAISRQHHLDVNHSDVIRQAIAYLYHSASKGSEDKK